MISPHVRRLRELVGNEVLELPSVTIIVRDEEARILLVKHADTGSWTTPGGAIEPEEVPSDSAVRETWEETGLHVRLTRLSGVYGGKEFVIEYSNGDRTSYAMIVFEAVPIGGELRPDQEETLSARFFSRAELGNLELPAWLPEVLEGIFAGGTEADYRQPTWSPPGTA